LRRQFWRSGSRTPQAQPFHCGSGKRANTGKHTRGGRNGTTKRSGSCNLLGVKLAACQNLRCLNYALRGARCGYSTRNRSCASGRRKGGNSACGARNIAATNARLDGVFFSINSRRQYIVATVILPNLNIRIVCRDNLNAFFWRTCHQRRSHKGLRISARHEARGEVIGSLVQFWHSGPIRQRLS
jgi:hypothetical protein